MLWGPDGWMLFPVRVRVVLLRDAPVLSWTGPNLLARIWHVILWRLGCQVLAFLDGTREVMSAMQSKPHHVPRCAKCLEKYKLQSPDVIGGMKFYPTPKWRNTEFVRPTNAGAIIRCKNCGHEWYSYGRAAREWRRKQENSTDC
jgi:hypothetical protein